MDHNDAKRLGGRAEGEKKDNTSIYLRKSKINGGVLEVVMGVVVWISHPTLFGYRKKFFFHKHGLLSVYGGGVKKSQSLFPILAPIIPQSIVRCVLTETLKVSKFLPPKGECSFSQA